MFPQYGELRPLAAEIGSLVWGTPTNFNGFRVLAALLHDAPAVGVSQTLRCRTEGAIYIRQGNHRVVPHITTAILHYIRARSRPRRGRPAPGANFSINTA